MGNGGNECYVNGDDDDDDDDDDDGWLFCGWSVD